MSIKQVRLALQDANIGGGAPDLSVEVAQLESDVFTLQGEQTVQNNAILALQSSDGLQNTNIGNLQTTQTTQGATLITQANDIATLQSSDIAQNNNITILQAASAAQKAKINELITRSGNVSNLGITANFTASVPQNKAAVLIVVQKTNGPTYPSQTISNLRFGRTSGANDILNVGNITIAAGVETAVFLLQNTNNLLSTAASSIFVSSTNWNAGTFNFYFVPLSIADISLLP